MLQLLTICPLLTLSNYLPKAAYLTSKSAHQKALRMKSASSGTFAHHSLHRDKQKPSRVTRDTKPQAATAPEPVWALSAAGVHSKAVWRRAKQVAQMPVMRQS